LRQDFSTIFVTPGLRLQAGLPFFSPFIAAGGGLAHYSGTASVNSSTVGVFQVGGGLDFNAIPFLKLRAEVREFHNGTPNFNVGQNNVFAGAGLVLKF
jgi:opacity protein-like surface antigen